MDDRHVDEAHDPDDGCPRRAARGVVGDPPDGEVADVDQEQDGRGREPRVPGPPRPPHGLSPQHPERDRERREQHADLGRGRRDPVPPRLLRLQVRDARDEQDEERQVREPCRRNVHVHDALDLALDRVGRRDHEREHGRGRERDQRGDAERSLAVARRRLAERALRGGRHQSSRRYPNTSTPTDRKTMSNAASRPSHDHASLAGPLAARSVARTPAISTGATSGSTSIGKIASRVRADSATTPNRLPTAASPTTPSTNADSIRAGLSTDRSNSRTTSTITARTSASSSSVTAAALPRNTAALSIGARSRPSSAPSSDSTWYARREAMTAENSTAIHSRPGATWSSTSRPGPNANPNEISTVAANGSSVPSACRPRTSITRSLRAITDAWPTSVTASPRRRRRAS